MRSRGETEVASGLASPATSVAISPEGDPDDDFDDFLSEGAPADDSPGAVEWLEEEHEAHPDFLTVTIH